jgi:hypothetical protein
VGRDPVCGDVGAAAAGLVRGAPHPLLLNPISMACTAVSAPALRAGGGGGEGKVSPGPAAPTAATSPAPTRSPPRASSTCCTPWGVSWPALANRRRASGY